MKRIMICKQLQIREIFQEQLYESMRVKDIQTIQSFRNFQYYLQTFFILQNKLNQIKLKMGETQSVNLAPQKKVVTYLASQFIVKVHKVSEMQSEQWGKFNLFQQKEKPYDYFMQFVQNQIDEVYLKKKQIFYQSLYQPKNKNIVPVAFTQINKNKGLCNTVYQLAVYCQYFNFTLQNAIKLKNKQKQMFSLPDVMYIVKSLVLIGKFCEQKRKQCAYLGIFKAKHIFITPEGHLRIYPFSENLSEMFISHKDEDQSSTFYKFRVKQQNQSEQKISEPTKYFLTEKLANNGFQNIVSRQLKKGLKIMNSKQQFFTKSIQHEFKEFEAQRKFSHQIFQNFSSRHTTTRRQDMKDFFDFGLLLLQMFLLNQIQYYQIYQDQKNYLKYNYQQSDKFQFQKKYNMDRIKFSIQKQLLYKKTPKKIMNLIQKMILAPQSMSYDLIQKILSQVQQGGVNTSFCLRFQIQSQESQLNLSKISSNFNQKIQRQSEGSFNIIQQPQSIYLQQIEDLKGMNGRMGHSNINLRNASSSFLKNEKNGEPKSKLKKSFMLSNQLSKNSLISNMKIDKFLIPGKIRSISTQVSKNCSQKQL